jgi:hypothetical protein
MYVLLFVMSNFALGVCFHQVGFFELLNLTSMTDTYELGNILMFLVAIVTMLTVSYFFVKLFKKSYLVGTVICTSLMGLVSSVMFLVLTNKLLHKFGFSEGKDAFGPVVSSVIIVIGVAISIYLGLKLANTVIFACVAFFCSYTFVRGISLLLGGFVNEANLAVGVLTDRNMPEMSFAFGLYVLAIFFCWISLLFHLKVTLPIKAANKH